LPFPHGKSNFLRGILLFPHRKSDFLRGILLFPHGKSDFLCGILLFPHSHCKTFVGATIPALQLVKLERDDIYE